jgi:hypothetical protein
MQISYFFEGNSTLNIKEDLNLFIEDLRFEIPVLQIKPHFGKHDNRYIFKDVIFSHRPVKRIRLCTHNFLIEGMGINASHRIALKICSFLNIDTFKTCRYTFRKCKLNLPEHITEKFSKVPSKLTNLEIYECKSPIFPSLKEGVIDVMKEDKLAIFTLLCCYERYKRENLPFIPKDVIRTLLSQMLIRPHLLNGRVKIWGRIKEYGAVDLKIVQLLCKGPLTLDDNHRYFVDMFRKMSKNT